MTISGGGRDFFGLGVLNVFVDGKGLLFEVNGRGFLGSGWDEKSMKKFFWDFLRVYLERLLLNWGVFLWCSQKKWHLLSRFRCFYFMTA